MRKRNATVAFGALLVLVAVVRHPTADIEILTHRDGDPTPHRIQAAVDLGVVAIKFLLTWTSGNAVDH
jgi:hypothetical protein